MNDREETEREMLSIARGLDRQRAERVGGRASPDIEQGVRARLEKGDRQGAERLLASASQNLVDEILASRDIDGGKELLDRLPRDGRSVVRARAVLEEAEAAFDGGDTRTAVEKAVAAQRIAKATPEDERKAREEVARLNEVSGLYCRYREPPEGLHNRVREANEMLDGEDYLQAFEEARDLNSLLTDISEPYVGFMVKDTKRKLNRAKRIGVDERLIHLSIQKLREKTGLFSKAPPSEIIWTIIDIERDLRQAGIEDDTGPENLGPVRGARR